MTNQSFGTAYETDGADGWRDFDKLPAEIRRVIDRAPYKVCCGAVRERYLSERQLRGFSLMAFRKGLIEALCHSMMRQTRKTYGPEHPDAQRSRLERRA